MTPTTFTFTDPTEILLIKQALGFVRELKKTSNSSPDGQVLHNVESFCLKQGREFLRQAMTTILQSEAPEVEKKGYRREFAAVDSDAITKVATISKS